MGVALDTHQLPSSVPPGKYGGNLDLHNLTAGSSLYLPVLVPGALFYVSESHFAQGNGEVSLTAIEASLRATLRLTVIKKGSPDLPMPAPLQMPFAETANHWIPIGIADDLGDAMAVCIRQSVAFLENKLGFKPNNAIAFLSIGADFDISEVVDQVKEVHAVIPKAALRQTKRPSE
jgi:acetamidase/formamidase